MIKFIFFFLSFLANLVIIKMMPDASLRAYINIYTIVGACGALLFFLIYSQEACLSHIKKMGVGLLLVYTLAYVSFNGFWASVFVYPLIIIYNDYIVTQSGVAKGGNFYRLFLIFSATPFLLFENNFEIFFQIRILLMVVILIFYIVKTKEVTTLRVRATWKYIFFNYTFYYAPLLLIANMSLTPPALKVWYIFSQGGLVIYLKYLDFAIRKNHTVSRHIGRLILFAAACAPILPVFSFPSATGLIAYFIGLLGLVYSKRYLNIKIS